MEGNKLEELAVLLPCHSLDDFPVHLAGAQAEELLSAWTALWSPALISAAGSPPVWHFLESLPEEKPEEKPEKKSRLWIIPEATREHLEEEFEHESGKYSEEDADEESEIDSDRASHRGFDSMARGLGAIILPVATDRNQLVSAALEALGLDLSECDPLASDPEVVADFFALGYGYLQVELLTRHMRYTSHIDETYFTKQVNSAAAAAVRGDREATEESLAACFDALSETRDHFYPVDSFLIDLTLIAPTTLGSGLQESLERSTPSNLLMSGSLLEQMADQHPASLAAVRQALDQETAAIVGGEYEEQTTSFQTHEQIHANLSRGVKTYEERLGHRPTVFGRFSAGLSATLPLLLRASGFQGALHFSFDGRSQPRSNQCVQQWQGIDETTIDALFREPLDASQTDVLLSLGTRLGESMDLDHVATLVFAHWPDGASPYYEDLRRVAARSNALGRFVTLPNYFEESADYGQPISFSQNNYQSHALGRAISRDSANAISSVVSETRSDTVSCSKNTTLFLKQILESANLPNDTATSNASDSEGDTDNPSKILINPLGRAVESRIAIDDLSTSSAEAIVSAPSLGYRWFDPSQLAAEQAEPPVPLASENQLRNEFIELNLNPVTGAIQSVHDYQVRGNLASAQIAFRDAQLTPGDKKYDYSVMAADSVCVTRNDSVAGEITVEGRLLDRVGVVVARFVQRVLLARRSRIAELDIELEPVRRPSSDPWQSYYAFRLAWPGELAQLRRDVGVQSIAAPDYSPRSERLLAPHFVEIESREKIAILSTGHAFHRRSSDRTLDTLLIAGSEEATHFRLGLGVGLAYPLSEAIGFTRSSVPSSEDSLEDTLYEAPCPKSGESGWFFHTGCKNVTATHWEKITREQTETGYRVRLLETEGRNASVRLQSYRRPKTARVTNLIGEQIEILKIADSTVHIEMARYGWVQVEVEW